MSFKEWLYNRLTIDEVIDDTWEESDLTESDLLEGTNLDEAELEDYRNEFKEVCEDQGVEPDWDLD